MNQDWVGVNVQRNREMLGLSQEELASLCRMRPQFLQSIEEGRVSNLHALTLKKLSTALCCPMEDLVRTPENPVELSAALAIEDGWRLYKRIVALAILGTSAFVSVCVMTGITALIVHLCRR